MTEYHKANGKLLNLKLNKLTHVIKNATDTTQSLLLNMIKY